MDIISAFFLGVGFTCLVWRVWLDAHGDWPRPEFIVFHDGVAFFGVRKMQLKPNQRVLLSIIALTASGQPGKFDGEPEWTSTDEGVVHLEPVPGDPLSVWAYSGEEGNATVRFEADADLDEGETRLIAAELDFTVVGEEVVTVELRAGSPEDVPA